MAAFALTAVILAGSGLTQMVFAASSGAGNPGGGLAIPYISGRLGPVEVPVDPPVGGVVPDDFCLPGKFEDCGDHLRGSADISPVPQTLGGPIFVGGDNPAFLLAPTKAWGQTQFRQTSLNSGSEQVDERSYFIGADHRFGDTFILGAMVVRSNLTTSFNLTGIQDTETGNFVGPYMALRLSDIWALDARFIAGSSHHVITASGIFDGEYDSTGGFGAVRVSGTFDRGNWRLHPSLEIATIFQKSEAYVIGTLGPQSAETISDSFVTAALLGYYNGLRSGSLVPYAGIEISQPTGGAGRAFGVIRGGMAWKMNNGGVLNFDFAHGAIGLLGLEDQQISLRLELPI